MFAPLSSSLLPATLSAKPITKEEAKSEAIHPSSHSLPSSSSSVPSNDFAESFLLPLEPGNNTAPKLEYDSESSSTSSSSAESYHESTTQRKKDILSSAAPEFDASLYAQHQFFLVFKNPHIEQAFLKEYSGFPSFRRLKFLFASSILMVVFTSLVDEVFPLEDRSYESIARKVRILTLILFTLLSCIMYLPIFSEQNLARRPWVLFVPEGVCLLNLMILITMLTLVFTFKYSCYTTYGSDFPLTLFVCTIYQQMLFTVRVPYMIGYVAYQLLLVTVSLPYFNLEKTSNAPYNALVSLLYIYGANIIGFTKLYLFEADSRKSFVLECKLRQKKEKVSTENQRLNALLRNILPESMIPDVKVHLENPTSAAITKSHKEMSVLISDIVDFTHYASNASAEEVVDVLNQHFTVFDALSAKYSIEKVKTIGDAYFAYAIDQNHAIRATKLGIKMIRAIKKINRRNNWNFEIRVGIAVGSTVLSVIGNPTVSLTFDCYGSAVELARTMESTGLPQHVHVTERVASAIGSSFELIPFKKEFMYPKYGNITSYLVKGKKSASRREKIERRHDAEGDVVSLLLMNKKSNQNKSKNTLVAAIPFHRKKGGKLPESLALQTNAALVTSGLEADQERGDAPISHEVPEEQLNEVLITPLQQVSHQVLPTLYLPTRETRAEYDESGVDACTSFRQVYDPLLHIFHDWDTMVLFVKWQLHRIMISFHLISLVSVLSSLLIAMAVPAIDYSQENWPLHPSLPMIIHILCLLLRIILSVMIIQYSNYIKGHQLVGLLTVGFMMMLSLVNYIPFVVVPEYYAKLSNSFAVFSELITNFYPMIPYYLKLFLSVIYEAVYKVLQLKTKLPDGGTAFQAQHAGNSMIGIFIYLLHNVIEFQRSAESFMINHNLERELSIIQAENKLNMVLIRSSLPLSVIGRMQGGESKIFDSFKDTIVCFVAVSGIEDVISLDARSELNLKGIRFLGTLFSAFDRECLKRGISKIKSINNVFLAVSFQTDGSDVPSKCLEVMEMALKFQRIFHSKLKKFHQKYHRYSQHLESETRHANGAARKHLHGIASITGSHSRSHLYPVHALPTITLQIGLARGPLVAGVLGHSKFLYDVFGDTVNVASRMVSSCESNKIQMCARLGAGLRQLPSAAVRNTFRIQERGIIKVKGKGHIRTFYLFPASCASPSDG